MVMCFRATNVIYFIHYVNVFLCLRLFFLLFYNYMYNTYVRKCIDSTFVLIDKIRRLLQKVIDTYSISNATNEQVKKQSLKYYKIPVEILVMPNRIIYACVHACARCVVQSQFSTFPTDTNRNLCEFQFLR